MMSRLVSVLCVCLIFALLSSTAALAETRTTPVEVENSPTVEISPTNNLVQTQVKSLKVSPIATTLTIEPHSAAYVPDVTCTGYKEARVVLYSAVPYTVAQDLSLLFYYDSVAVGTTPWWSVASGENQYDLMPICTTYTGIFPVLGNTLKIRITNNSDSAVTIASDKCWVYLVN